MSPDPSPATSEMRKLCICEPCPTYNECMRANGELLFCVTGKTIDCTFVRKGCICPQCPVKPLLGLKKAYFCIRGSEHGQA